MTSILRNLFFLLVIKPLALIVIGLNVRHLELLPSQGPAVIVANHNSHLDTMVLLSLFPVRTATKIRPVAAADYFLSNRVLAWFSLNILQIVPIDRSSSAKSDPLLSLSEALDQHEILLLFPEGTRGEPERLSHFRSGIAHLSKRHPDVPITPVYLHGLGKALPKGEALLVPFFCDVFVGESLFWCGHKDLLLENLINSFNKLAGQGHFPEWK